MEMKGSYKVVDDTGVRRLLVCDMEMKGSYKVPQYQCHRVRLVCDMEMKGSYKNFLSYFLLGLYVTWK